jgi:hypothetical protein
MNAQEIIDTAMALVAGDKGLPAMAAGTTPSPRRRSDDITRQSCVPV